MTYINMNPQQFKTAIETKKNVVLLDVRTPKEVAENKLEGAIVIDFLTEDFAKKVIELDKEKAYYIYCRSGVRSANACQMMSQLGFKELINLEGGILAWNF